MRHCPVSIAGKFLRGFLSSRHETVFGTPTPQGWAGIIDAALEGKLGFPNTLSGIVETTLDLKQAADVTAAVPGISRVTNNLKEMSGAYRRFGN